MGIRRLSLLILACIAAAFHWQIPLLNKVQFSLPPTCILGAGAKNVFDGSNDRRNSIFSTVVVRSAEITNVDSEDVHNSSVLPAFRDMIKGFARIYGPSESHFSVACHANLSPVTVAD